MAPAASSGRSVPGLSVRVNPAVGGILRQTLAKSTNCETALEHARQGSRHSLTSGLVCGHGIDRRRSNALVAERLLDNSKVDVGFDQGNTERMLQTVEMALVLGQSGSLRDIGKDSMQLGTVNPARFLADERKP